MGRPDKIVSVVITTHDRAHQLGLCLRSIFDPANDVVPDEVCIVDDRSTDGTPAVVRDRLANEYPIRFLARTGASGWQNPAIPRNMAIRLTRKDATHLWFLEPETLLFPGTLRQMLDHFLADPSRDIWVNAVRQGFITKPISAEEALRPEWVWGQNFVYRDPSPHLAVRCALMPRRAVFELRGYDESFSGWGHDDSDWMTRMETYGCRRADDFAIRILHQFHAPAPAQAETANANLAISQANAMRGVYAVNDPWNWGTDNGKYSWLAE